MSERFICDITTMWDGIYVNAVYMIYIKMKGIIGLNAAAYMVLLKRDLLYVWMLYIWYY